MIEEKTATLEKVSFGGMPDYVSRALRTFTQAFLPILFVGLFAYFSELREWSLCLGSEGECDLPSAAIIIDVVGSALIAGAIALLSFLQNLAEENGLMKPLFGKNFTQVSEVTKVVVKDNDGSGYGDYDLELEAESLEDDVK